MLFAQIWQPGLWWVNRDRSFLPVNCLADGLSPRGFEPWLLRSPTGDLLNRSADSLIGCDRIANQQYPEVRSSSLWQGNLFELGTNDSEGVAKVVRITPKLCVANDPQ